MNLLKKIILSVLASGLAVFITSYYFPNHLSVSGGIIPGGILAFLLSGMVFGVLNSFIKPILKILSFPFILLTLGLFILFINGLIVYFTEFLFNNLNNGMIFEIKGGFLSYILVAIILGTVNHILHWFVEIK